MMWDPARIESGTIIADKYVVDRVLGAGGMGVVLAARHKSLGQPVAIKMLLQKPDGQATARFVREARAAAGILGEHVVRVIDIDTLDDGTPYMVMEYLSGSDLSDLVRVRGPLPIPDAVDYVLQACEALAEAHRSGVVHRDLKPANLFLTARPDGSPLVKVLDFGISKLIDPSAMGTNAASLTRTSAVMGSPLYMSPEQVRDAKQVDRRTDIWALGVILWELLTGDAPFVADTLPALSVKIATEPLASLTSFRSDIPPNLDAAILRCLEKDPSRRFQGVADLAREIAPYATGGGIVSLSRIVGIAGGFSEPPPGTMLAATAPMRTAAADPTGGVGTAPGWGNTKGQLRSGRSQRVWWALGAAGGAGLLAAIVALTMREPGVVTTETAKEVHAAGADVHRPVSAAVPVPQGQTSEEPEPSSRPSQPTGASNADAGSIAPIVSRTTKSTATGARKNVPAKVDSSASKPKAATSQCPSGYVWNGRRCDRPLADEL